jgi:hypothetical protein
MMMMMATTTMMMTAMTVAGWILHNMEISIYYERKLMQRVKILKLSFISRFHYGINVIFALLGGYAALIGNWLQKFADNM